MIGVPVVLSSKYTFPSAANSISSPDDPHAVRTPRGEAMFVDGIQLWVKGLGLAAGTWHEWEVLLGRARLTDGFVPPSLCTRFEEPVTSAVSTANRQAFLWLFARPLYVPAGRVLQVRVKTGLASSTANVALYGRVLPEGYAEPKVIPVPYACAYRPALVTPNTAETDVSTYIYKSNSSDLVNPFSVPMTVNRFVMAMVGANVAGGAPYDYTDTFTNYVSAKYFPSIQLFAQSGAPVVRDAVKVAQFCSLIRNEWAVKHVLKPKEAIFAVVDQTHASSATTTTKIQVGIGMVGWRDVPISEVK